MRPSTTVTDGDLEIRVRPGDGRRDPAVHGAPPDAHREGGGVTGAVVSVEDVTESAQLHAELERRATHDLLTRVMNRGAAMDALEAALARRATGTAVIYVDIDHFKSVNDQLGHVVGDELLQIVADRLAATVRAGDTLGRVGGDEFLVVCPGVAGAEPALAVAHRIATAVNRPVRLAGMSMNLQASIGVAHSGRRVISADALVGRADAAMYASKRGGHGRPVAYSGRRSERHHSETRASADRMSGQERTHPRLVGPADRHPHFQRDHITRTVTVLVRPHPPVVDPAG